MLPDVTLPDSLCALLAVFEPCFTGRSSGTVLAAGLGLSPAAAWRTVCGDADRGGTVADLGASPCALFLRPRPGGTLMISASLSPAWPYPCWPAPGTR